MIRPPRSSPLFPSPPLSGSPALDRGGGERPEPLPACVVSPRPSRDEGRGAGGDDRRRRAHPRPPPLTSPRRRKGSEERRGGEEGRSRWAPDHLKKKKENNDV